MDPVDAWAARGEYLSLGGHRIFVLDHRPGEERADPVLILHGYPSCSFDWRHVLDALGADRRVVLLDMLGYGLSDKPLDHRYSLFEQADIVCELIAARGLDRFALLTHDMGDSVGGEVLARDLDGALGATVTARVVTNGSIYMDLVHLSPGQELLLSMPDEPLPAGEGLTEDLFAPALAATFGADTQPSAEELRSQWALVSGGGGDRILQRLIRYVAERREHEPRWTGAIEQHPAPLRVVWGDADPIALVAMAERLCSRREGAVLERLAGIGHYPMIEAPEAFTAAVLPGLSPA